MLRNPYSEPLEYLTNQTDIDAINDLLKQAGAESGKPLLASVYALIKLKSTEAQVIAYERGRTDHLDTMMDLRTMYHREGMKAFEDGLDRMNCDWIADSDLKRCWMQGHECRRQQYENTERPMPKEKPRERSFNSH